MEYRYIDAAQTVIQRATDGACIPADPANSDYAALLADGAAIAPYQRFADAPAARIARRAELAARRWQAQCAFAYDGAAPIAYGPDTIGAVAAVIDSLMSAPPETTAPWKLGATEFRAWTLEEFQAFRESLTAHVLACFANEATLAAAMSAEGATIADIEGVDIAAGWPA